MLTVLTVGRKVDRKVKVVPEKGSPSKIKSKLVVSVVQPNYTKTNLRAFGIN